MEQRRLILFLTLSMGFMLLWSEFVAPPIPLPPPDAEVPAGGEQFFPQDGPAAGAADAESYEHAGGERQGVADVDVDPPGEAADNQPAEFTAHPYRTLTLGSLNPESGYFMAVQLTTRGAAVAAVHLNNPDYRELHDRTQPLQLLGDTATDYRTLSTSVEEIDVLLLPFDITLDRVDWEVVTSGSSDATFRFVAPGGELEVVKTYYLPRVDKRGQTLHRAWDNDPTGYLLQCDLTLHNRGEQSASLTYQLVGPVGVRLENAEHARKFRDISIGFLQDGAVDTKTMMAGDVLEQNSEVRDAAAAQGGTLSIHDANQKLESWQSDFKYIGVDVQFFAALVVPLDERPLEQRAAAPWIAAAAQLERHQRAAGLEPDRDCGRPGCHAPLSTVRRPQTRRTAHT